ncbi:MAG TPA: FAD-binding oxidoreductase [Pseudonocardiaceae bacterium]|nr:FAD-binding oxidoreductase [Pseudonocardiaceae bacterium]
MVINRRSFLVAAGVAATASVAAGCSTGGRATAVVSTSTTATTSTTTTTTTTTTTAPTTTTAATPTAIDFPALAKSLSGPLLTPDSAGYALARRSYNPLYDTRRPAAIALCRTSSDVQRCVTAAAQSRTAVAARSGGHSYAGYSTPDGALVVDLAGLSAVRVSGGTAVVGAGARLIDVYAALAARGRCLPAGSCPSVGVAGLTLGGGIGVLARKYGLTCDHLTAATVVTADGAARTVSAGAEPDLFWALRGGGGGNFGVVTSFTFATVPAPALTVFQLGFPAGSVPDVFGAWQRWLRSAPDELWTNLNVTGAAGRSTCTVSGCFVGSAAALNPMLDRLVASTGGPRYRRVLPMSYLNAMRYFAGCAGMSMAQCEAETRGADWKRETFAASSRMLAAPVAAPARLADVADGHPGLHVIVDGLGGAVGRVAPTATAFGHRTALASVQIYLKTTVAGHAAAARQVSAVRDALTPVTGGGAYVNYIDAAMPDWATAYYGDNLPRLRTTAQRYDPDRVFTFAQAVNRS